MQLKPLKMQICDSGLHVGGRFMCPVALISGSDHLPWMSQFTTGEYAAAHFFFLFSPCRAYKARTGGWRKFGMASMAIYDASNNCYELGAADIVHIKIPDVISVSNSDSEIKDLIHSVSGRAMELLNVPRVVLQRVAKCN
jgi:hypothetical protein